MGDLDGGNKKKGQVDVSSMGLEEGLPGQTAEVLVEARAEFLRGLNIEFNKDQLLGAEFSSLLIKHGVFYKRVFSGSTDGSALETEGVFTCSDYQDKYRAALKKAVLDSLSEPGSELDDDDEELGFDEE